MKAYGLLFNIMKRFFFIFPIFLLILLLIPGCSLSKGSTFLTVIEADKAGEEAEEEEEEEEETEEKEAFTILSDPSGASVYINNRYTGETPLEMRNLAPGTYKITMEMEGYYTAEAWVSYSGGDQSVELTLERIMGYISISIDPPNAQIILGSESLTLGLTRVPVGFYNLKIRSFGYEDYTVPVTINENRTTSVDVILQEAEFRLYDPTLSRASFNPGNPGLLGKTLFTFQVSNYGRAIFSIIDSTGGTVLEEEMPYFSTWEQTYLWDGKSGNGQTLPDGSYMLQIAAKGEKEGLEKILEQCVSLDHSLTIAYRSLWSGTPGLLYTGTPDVLPARSFQISSLFLGHVEQNLYRAPLALSFRLGLGYRMEMDLLAGLILEDVAYLPLTFSAAYRYKYLESGRRVGFQMALSGKLTYHLHTGTDTFGNFTGISLGNAARLSIGPVSLIFFPEIILSPWRITYDLTYDDAVNANVWLYGRAGVMVDLGAFVAGLSTTVRSLPFSEDFGIDLPFQSGLEVHAMLPGTQIFLSLLLAAEIESLNDWYLMGGLGLGYIY